MPPFHHYPTHSLSLTDLVKHHSALINQKFKEIGTIHGLSEWFLSAFWDDLDTSDIDSVKITTALTAILPPK